MKYVSHLRKDIEWGNMLASDGILGPVYACCLSLIFNCTLFHSQKWPCLGNKLFPNHDSLAFCLLFGFSHWRSDGGRRMRSGNLLLWHPSWLVTVGWLLVSSLSPDDTSHWWGEWGTGKIPFFFHPSFLMAF